MKSQTSLKMGHVGPKTRSLGKILEKPFVRSRGHIFSPIVMKRNKNVCFDETSDELKCNSSPDKHVFLYLFPDCLCIIIHFSVSPTTIRARVLCLFAQVCKRKNPIREPRLDLAVILVTSRYEDDTLPVNSEQ